MFYQPFEIVRAYSSWFSSKVSRRIDKRSVRQRRPGCAGGGRAGTDTGVEYCGYSVRGQWIDVYG